jgi:Tol biopolymer transport system component
MGRLAHACLGVSVAMVAIAVAAGPAAGSYPGSNGRIVFSTGTNDLWSVNADGGDRQLLTTVPSSSGGRSFVSFPSFSADGSKLAVMLNELDRPTPCDPQALNAGSGYCHSIVLMNADGSNQRIVYASEDIGSLDLALSPDGSKIAFTEVTSFGEQLFIVDATGRPPRLLTRQNRRKGATDTAPSWSPDGTTIAFMSSRDQALTGHSWSLFSVSLRTSQISRIIPNGTNNDLEPDWAPDGSKLVFMRTFGYPDYRIYTVDTDGSGESELLADASADARPIWSPEGNQILYLRQGQLWLVNLDGSGAHSITTGGSYGFSWQPVPN